MSKIEPEQPNPYKPPKVGDILKGGSAAWVLIKGRLVHSSPTAIGCLVERVFGELKQTGVSATSTYPIDGHPQYGYPPPKTNFFVAEPDYNRQTQLSLPLAGGLESLLTDVQSIQNYLRSRVEQTGRFGFNGVEPIFNSANQQIGSRLYFQHKTKENYNPSGQKEKIESNGLVVVFSVLPLSQRELVSEVSENSRNGYHTLFVLHEQSKDGVYRHHRGGTYIYPDGQNYAALGEGSVVFCKPPEQHANILLKSVSLSGGEPEIKYISEGWDVQIMAYWKNSPIYRVISSGLGGGIHTNGRFEPLEIMLDRKPLLLAYFVQPRYSVRQRKI